MADFIGRARMDGSIPLPTTAAVSFEGLYYSYEKSNHKIYLRSKEGKPVQVSADRSLVFPKEILNHMGITPGCMILMTYSVVAPHSRITISNHETCARCGDPSVPRHMLRPMFARFSLVCGKCRAEIMKELDQPEECEDYLTPEEEAESERQMEAAIEREREEERTNNSLHIRRDITPIYVRAIANLKN